MEERVVAGLAYAFKDFFPVDTSTPCFISI